ncbi:MAG: putative phosphatase [Clostridiales bacterium]|nr:putative phosphatase [Clostridiales bacterium]
MKGYKHIIWDWNGTLLDDVEIVIQAMNHLLKKRGLPLIDYETYKSIFAFPVKSYYIELGFDFKEEPFEKLAAEYIEEFNSDKYCFKLFNEAEKVLSHFYNIGIGESILSASQEEELNGTVNRLGIKKYFKRIVGLNNHYANSKVDRGKELLTELNLKSEEVILVGDTIHDYEVACELGCNCLLISNGHQSYDRIEKLPVNIVSSLLDVSKLIQEITVNSGSK